MLKTVWGTLFNVYHYLLMQRWGHILTTLLVSSPLVFTASAHLRLPYGGSKSLLLPLPLTARFCDSCLYRAASGLSMNMAQYIQRWGCGHVESLVTGCAQSTWTQPHAATGQIRNQRDNLPTWTNHAKNNNVDLQTYMIKWKGAQNCCHDSIVFSLMRSPIDPPLPTV